MKRLFLILLLAASILLTACAAPTASKWQEQYDLGMRYLSEGNYEEAIVAFTAAIEIDPKQASFYVGRASAYIGSGETEANLDAAATDYEYALSVDAKLTDTYLGLADVYIRRGDYDRALEILRKGQANVEDHGALDAKIAEIESGNVTDSSGKKGVKLTTTNAET